MWINITTGKILLTHSDIRSDIPNTSLPSVITDLLLSEFGYEPVTLKPPVYNLITQSATETAPVKIDGVWTQQWVISELSAEQAEINRKATVPQSVTMRQACIQLEVDGLLDDVEAIVATLPRVYQIEWQRASNVFRDNPLVEMVRQQKGMTSAQIDDLFIAADKR